MTRLQTRKHLRSLLDQLMDLHAELEQLSSSPLSPETRRLFSDTLEQCLRIHRLILASVRTAASREPASHRA